ncbi:MAG: hypothetical protein PSX81_08295 [bacterium]|nr:hypothetical protein [bacterium]
MFQIKRFFVLLVLIASFANAYASLQRPDILIIGKDTLPLWRNPLESDTVFAKMRNMFKETMCASDCWRGYEAQFTLIDSQLYLTNLISACFTEDSLVALYKKTFPEITNGIGRKVTWLNFPLLTSRGSIIKVFHNQAYHKINRREIYMYFKNGKWQKSDTFTYEKTLVLTLSDNREMLENFIYSKVDWSALPKEKIQKETEVSLLFYWGNYGNTEGIIASSVDAEVAEVINKTMRLISNDLKAQWYTWNVIITIKPERIKPFLSKD